MPYINNLIDGMKSDAHTFADEMSLLWLSMIYNTYFEILRHELLLDKAKP